MASCRCVRPIFTMSLKAADLAASVDLSFINDGSNRLRMASTAATCIAVGNTSLDDWLMFTSSFGWTRRPSPRLPPSSSLARLASTSLTFMLVCVPEPVCHTTSGNSSSCCPASTSSAAAMMAAALVSSRMPSRWFTTAEDRLIWLKARMISLGWRSPEMSKFCSERWV